MILKVKKIYYGWWVSIAGAMNTLISSIPTFTGGSIIFKAIEDEFGWSRAIVSGVSSFGRFGGALLGPIEGYLSDKFGAWKMILLGFIIASLGLFWLSTINSILFYYISYLVVSIGVSIGGFVPSMATVNVWMPHKRSTAMSWVIGGSSIGGFFMPFMVFSIEEYGWRLTMVILGILFFEVLFKNLVSPSDAKQYIAGMILLGLAPCTAMVFVWSNLTKGDPNFTLLQVSVNDIILLFVFAPLAALYLGISEIIVPWGTLLAVSYTHLTLPTNREV